MYSPNTYEFKLVGGPLDGLVLDWQWFDDEMGREGEAKGIIGIGGEGDLVYVTVDRRTAHYKSGTAVDLLEKLKKWMTRLVTSTWQPTEGLASSGPVVTR